VSRINLESVLSDIKSWASSEELINRVYLAGSYSQDYSDKELLRESDIDIIIFLNPNADDLKIYSGLSRIGTFRGILLHPLIIHFEDSNYKMKIAKYKKMLGSAILIYESNALRPGQ